MCTVRVSECKSTASDYYFTYDYELNELRSVLTQDTQIPPRYKYKSYDTKYKYNERARATNNITPRNTKTLNGDIGLTLYYDFYDT
jgi:hypothetical protein